MRRGVRIGVDVGSVRVGVARSDIEGLMGLPVVTLARGQGDLEQLAELVREYEAIEVFVGLPRQLSGKEGAAATAVREYGEALAASIAPIKVSYIDERLTTVSANRDLRDAGRTTRTSRSVIDQAAAVIIVESALAAERSALRAEEAHP